MSDSHLVVSDSLQPHGLYSLPGFSVHGILQTRIMERVAITFCKQVIKTVLFSFRRQLKILCPVVTSRDCSVIEHTILILALTYFA